jgi:uncharacterized protein
VRFLADCNVGRLARRLRMLGFDAAYHRSAADGELVRQALAEGRVLLTRDRDLLKRRAIAGGLLKAVFLVDDGVDAQLRQVISELQLKPGVILSRCLECNLELEPRPAAAVAARVPAYVRATQLSYSECPGCGRVYWAGTHWRRMREAVARL